MGSKRMSLTTAREMSGPIGAHGIYEVGTNLDFQVRIVDARQRYGQTDYLIEPVAGQGRKWVSHESVRITQS